MRLTRRTLMRPLGAVVTAAVLGTGVFTVAHFAQRSDAAPRLAPIAVPTASAGLLPNADDVPAHAAGALPDAADTALSSSNKADIAVAPISLRYTFDGGVNQPIVDESGGHELRAQGQNGGTLSLVPQGTGLAVRYPVRCTLIPEAECPRAILEGVRDDALNPGLRPLQYGASVLMTHADLADGANVVQKGYSVGGGSQFKLQVDHEQGRPSCVIAGPSRIYRAEPHVDVADGVWHEVTCGRTGNRLVLTIDGTERASVAVPRTLSIANTAPLRVGGKGANKGNDQFAGQIDNVFLTIG